MIVINNESIVEEPCYNSKIQKGNSFLMQRKLLPKALKLAAFGRSCHKKSGGACNATRLYLNGICKLFAQLWSWQLNDSTKSLPITFNCGS